MLTTVLVLIIAALVSYISYEKHQAKHKQVNLIEQANFDYSAKSPADFVHIKEEELLAQGKEVSKLLGKQSGDIPKVFKMLDLFINKHKLTLATQIWIIFTVGRTIGASEAEDNDHGLGRMMQEIKDALSQAQAEHSDKKGSSDSSLVPADTTNNDSDIVD